VNAYDVLRLFERRLGSGKRWLTTIVDDTKMALIEEVLSLLWDSLEVKIPST